MLILKVLGGIDLTSSLAFLMLTFGMIVPYQFLLFCAGLLFLKGMFVLTGDVLSIIDIGAAITLFVSIFFIPSTIFLWTFAFFLLAKGFISFL